MNSDSRSKCFIILFIMTLILTISILPIGCGGGGGGGGNGDNDGVNPTASEGVFLDSPVAGLDYETATQSGVTDENGTFQYLTGEIVTFSIGKLELGSGIGQDLLTPIDLVSGAIDETDSTVTNICKLIQALDEDGDLSNGIKVTNSIKAIVSDANLDFTLSTPTFDNDQNVQDLIESLNNAGVFTDIGLRNLPSDEEAQNHIADTLYNLRANIDNYIATWAGDFTITTEEETDTGEVTIVVQQDGTGSITIGTDEMNTFPIPSFTVISGILHFDLPNVDPGNSDCQNWDVSATLNLGGDFKASGTFCDDGGGMPGNISGSLSIGVPITDPIDNSEDNDGDGFTENQGDCDDGDINIFPGATELCDDGIDNDCDTAIDNTDTDCGGSLDNSIFYGTYFMTMAIGDCDPDVGPLTIGNDQSLSESDSYIYVPQAESSYTTNEGTITALGNTISIDLVEDDGDAIDIDLIFNNDYSSFTISGTITDDEPGECSGAATGGGTRAFFNKVSFPVTVRAQIDGVSQLMIKGSMIWWYHLEWEPPGLWEDEVATFLNGEEWYPLWPGDADNLTDCYCDSSSLDALETPLREDLTTISINVVSGRGEVEIVQQPNQINDYTAAIEFDDHVDGSLPGPDWYEIIIYYN